MGRSADSHNQSSNLPISNLPIPARGKIFGMNSEDQVLWEVSTPDGTTLCIMVSCCGGAELQIVRERDGDEEVVLRELYPDRSSLYDRARELRGEWSHQS